MRPQMSGRWFRQCRSLAVESEWPLFKAKHCKSAANYNQLYTIHRPLMFVSKWASYVVGGYYRGVVRNDVFYYDPTVSNNGNAMTHF